MTTIRSFSAALAPALASMLLAGPGLLASPLARAADDDIVYTARLTADEQSVPTESPGVGFAEIRLERATLRITWKVTYEGVTSPVVAAGLYGPENAGANAGQVVDLGTGGLKSPITGSAVISDGVLSYLVTGRVYVNLHTRKYKDGELRGQLRRVRQAPQPAPSAAPSAKPSRSGK